MHFGLILIFNSYIFQVLPVLQATKAENSAQHDNAIRGQYVILVFFPFDCSDTILKQAEDDKPLNRLQDTDSANGQPVDQSRILARRTSTGDIPFIAQVM